jgi:hypothetical protein
MLEGVHLQASNSMSLCIFSNLKAIITFTQVLYTIALKNYLQTQGISTFQERSCHRVLLVILKAPWK